MMKKSAGVTYLSSLTVLKLSSGITPPVGENSKVMLERKNEGIVVFVGNGGCWFVSLFSRDDAEQVDVGVVHGEVDSQISNRGKQYLGQFFKKCIKCI